MLWAPNRHKAHMKSTSKAYGAPAGWAPHNFRLSLEFQLHGNLYLARTTILENAQLFPAGTARCCTIASGIGDSCPPKRRAVRTSSTNHCRQASPQKFAVLKRL